LVLRSPLYALRFTLSGLPADPHQHFAILIDGQFFDLDKFFLEGFERIIVEVEL
jgi:hypothetical protein